MSINVEGYIATTVAPWGMIHEYEEEEFLFWQVDN